MKRFITAASIALSCNAFAGGYFERITPTFDYGNTNQLYLTLTGWACEPSTPDFQGWIHFWRDDHVFLGALPANAPREAAVGAACGGNHVHGFSGTLAVRGDGKYHNVHAYFIRLDGSVFELSQSPINVGFYKLPPWY